MESPKVLGTRIPVVLSVSDEQKRRHSQHRTLGKANLARSVGTPEVDRLVANTSAVYSLELTAG